MEDLISRQAAIDAVRKSYDAILDFESDGHTVADSFEDIINALPSAQPEITHEQAVEYLQSTGWMQNHDLQMMLDGVHRFTAQPEPCEDAVSRQAAIDGLNDAVHEHNITDFDAVATILALPSVTPKQRTGKWIDGIIPNDGGGLPVIVCDQCNTFFPLQFGDGHNFCPNCGADMRGEQDE